MNIYDEDGKHRSTDWLEHTFGPVTIHTPDGHGHTFEIVELRAATGHAAVIATVQDADGSPLPDISTIWHWPDAPGLPGAGWYNHGVIGRTNEQGHIGHAMGKGADYAPPTKGPHALWIQGTGSSQMIDGLGMITLEGRYHLDVTFQLRSETPPDPDPPTPAEPDPAPPPLPVVRADLLHILRLLIEARRLVETLLVLYNESEEGDT